jgi:hypothetical protein
VLNFANFGLQFLCANVTFAFIQLNQGARMGDLSDRREARRFTMTLPVRVLAHEANSPELKAHTRDVSYRGLYFLSEARFENGSEIDFIITLPQQMISAGDVNIRCPRGVQREWQDGSCGEDRALRVRSGARQRRLIEPSGFSSIIRPIFNILRTITRESRCA